MLVAIAPIPGRALSQDTVPRALDLADRERTSDALAMLGRIIAAQPTLVAAHAALVRIKVFYLNRYDAVRAEYDRLMTAHPDDVTYPTAFILGAQGALPTSTQMEWYQRIAEKSPNSYWGHYARAQLVLRSQPESAARELRAAISQDPDSPEAYDVLIYVTERILRDSDHSMSIAEEMSTRPNLVARALPVLWRLQLAKEQGSESAKQELRRALGGAAQTSDMTMLAAVRQTYAAVLNDGASAEQIAARMRKIDPSWYPERGVTTIFVPTSPGGVDRVDTLAGRALSYFGKVREAADISDPAARLAALQTLLKSSPTAVITRFIRERMFVAAEADGNVKTVVSTAQALMRIDPADAAVPARVALLLGARTETRRDAMHYAEVAARLTEQWRPISRPRDTDARAFAERVPETKQRDIFRRQRALALDARGYSLCRAGECKAAESLLRESVNLDRAERNLTHLADILDALNRKGEANLTRTEATAEFAASVRRKMISEPAKDFRLRTIAGESVSLSDLNGKVVVLNFWATWCGPCRTEMPRLVNLDRAMKSRGLQVLGVTTETPNERERIEQFVRQMGVTYPILYADGIDEKYGVNGVPMTFVIDQAGKLRFRASGFQSDTTMRELEAVANELLK